MSNGNPIVIDTINIVMSTNIPNQPNISLTSKTIVSTSPNRTRYNEYPYITSSCKLKDLSLNTKSLNDIIDIFFIKDIFVKYLDETGERNDKTELSVLNHNIKKMMLSLFHTFPIIGNVRNTIENEYITEPFNINKYSYLNINSKTYTISNVRWINDIYNHYLTKQLIKDYKEFKAWSIGEERNILASQKENDNKQKLILEEAKKAEFKNVFNTDIDTIYKYLTNPDNWLNNIPATITIRNAMISLFVHLVILQAEWVPDAVENKKLELEKAIAGKPKTRNTKNMESMILSELENKYNKGAYTITNSQEFASELNRSSKLVVDSNYIRISNALQNLIKDLNDNNEKKISLKNDMNYIKDELLILGNDKYKNENFKTLSSAFVKDVQLVKKNINYVNYQDFSFKKMKEFIDKLSNTNANNMDQTNDGFGIIYDNNNVSKPKYEIYMYVDLINGKITDANKDKIDLCSFRDELLLTKFTQLMNYNTHNLQHDPLIQLLSVDKPKPNITAEKPNPIINTRKPKPSIQRGTTQRKQENIVNNNRTRKNI